MKSHFEILDGLRGTAALCMVLFHIAEIVTPSVALNPLRHTHLAVDFFFALSGFVIAHAYDHRLSAMARPEERLTLWGFFLRRLIRLHPLAVVGMTLGLISFIFDPFVAPKSVADAQISVSTLSIVFGLSLLLLPSPPLPDRFGETHSLNAPSWSLFLEYIGSLLYGFFGHRISKVVLGILCVLSAIPLILTAQNFNNLSNGWDWNNAWVAFVRLAYPFMVGILLYRLKLRVRLPFAYGLLSLALIAIFAAPLMGAYNGLYEAVCVIVAFPLILCLGAGQLRLEGPMGVLCRLTGRLSYPIYIIHYPAMYVFAHWVWNTHPAKPLVGCAIAGLFIGVIAIGWLLLKYFDEPLRAYLSHKTRSPPLAHGLMPAPPTRP